MKAESSQPPSLQDSVLKDVVHPGDIVLWKDNMSGGSVGKQIHDYIRKQIRDYLQSYRGGGDRRGVELHLLVPRNRTARVMEAPGSSSKLSCTHTRLRNVRITSRELFAG